MSMWKVLANTYDAIKCSNAYSEETNPLLIDGMSFKNADVEIHLSADGKFISAQKLEKAESSTLIFVTYESMARTNKAAPHMIADELSYLVKNWDDICEDKNLVSVNEDKYQQFITQLQGFASYTSFNQVKTVCRYLEEGTILNDLITEKIIELNENGKLDFEKPAKPNKLNQEQQVFAESTEIKNIELSENLSSAEIFDAPENFKIVENFESTENFKISENLDSSENFENIENLEEAEIKVEAKKDGKGAGKNYFKFFVRFVVEDVDEKQTPYIHKNQQLFEEWSEYLDKENPVKLGLCYVTGENCKLAEKFPKYLRNPADGGKLITSNDFTIVTYGGRFNVKQSSQVMGISKKISSKAHAALKWLNKEYAFKRGELSIMMWNKQASNLNIIDYKADAEYWEMDSSFSEDLRQMLAKGFNKSDFRSDAESQVYVLVLDSATEGRINISQYCELTPSEYLENVSHYFNMFKWRFPLKNQQNQFVGSHIATPALHNVFRLCYSTAGPSDKVRKSFYLTMLECMINKAPLPKYLMCNAFEAVKKKSSFNIEYLSWDRALEIACALIKYYYKLEEKYMNLDETEITRDYLFGRLLAILEKAEKDAKHLSQDTSETNAERLFVQFSARPGATFKILREKIVPYFSKLERKAIWYENLIGEIISKMSSEDFVSPKPLGEKYLLGYYNQTQALWAKREKEETDKKEETEEN